MNLQPPIRRLLWCLLAWAALLALLVSLLDQQQFHALFTEGGPVESLTTPLWIALAAWCLDPTRRFDRDVAAAGGLALLLAMREADWQHDETANMSVLKLKYYAQAAVPQHDKIVAAVFTLLALAVLIYAINRGLRYLRRARGTALRPAWAQAFAAGVATLVAVKALDRLINSIADAFGYRIGGAAGRLVGGWEEGFELVLPLVFALALVLYRRDARE